MKHTATKIILFATMVLSLTPLVQATSTEHLKATTAHMGDSAYRVGNYTEAIEWYEQVLAEGFTSAELHYNLGNAYYRTDDMPHAILNYERALRIRPSMSDAKENLLLAQSKTVDHIDELPQFFATRWYNWLRTCVVPATWRTICILLLVIAVAATVVVIVGRSTKLRRWCLGVAIAGAILFVLAMAMLLSSTQWRNAHSEAIVMQQSVTVKGSPENQSSDKMILHAGTKVTISETLAGWNKIAIADGTSGWCPEEAIERI